ncbi:hypothetical protein KC364_g93 [Hortaea werneckii]|nr:hypothetical protein KC364_g93 [Hortaea werneckii]
MRDMCGGFQPEPSLIRASNSNHPQQRSVQTLATATAAAAWICITRADLSAPRWRQKAGAPARPSHAAAIHLQLSPQYDDIRRARFLFCMSYDPSRRVNGQEGAAGTATSLEGHLVYMHLHHIVAIGPCGGRLSGKLHFKKVQV